LLQHLAKHQPQRRRTVKLPAPRRQPRVLTAGQVQAILDACEHLRDRLLFAVLFDSGVRIGEALGLRHEDLAVAERQVTVTLRVNDNRARVKGGTPRTIPVSAELLRLNADYLHGEYGQLDSDYVFVNLWGQPRGRPLAYPAVYDLVGRLRRRTQIRFGPHQFRHAYATWLLRNGAGMETAKTLLGHRSLATTLDTSLRLPASRTIPSGSASPSASGCATSPPKRSSSSRTCWTALPSKATRSPMSSSASVCSSPAAARPPS
jgi:integrase/recombinase XerD